MVKLGMATAAMQVETNPRPREHLFRSSGQRKLVLSLLLALVTLASYNPVAQNGFVNFDDAAYITRNAQVQAGVTGQTLRWALTSTEAANWHPLTWISHALDYQLFGQKPVGHHYVNVLLHALTAVLLFLFLEATTGFMGRSVIVAALFALHPINVESVAWAAERKNVLCTLLFVLGLWGYAWYVRKPGLKRYLVVAGLFILGLMSKPAVITFPFVLLLMDYWPLRRIRFTAAANPSDSALPLKEYSLGHLVLEKIPLLMLSALSAAITMIAQRAGGAVRDQYPVSLRLANALVSYARYLGKAAWPSRLAVMYPFPRHGIAAWQVGAAIAILALTTLAVLALKRRRYLAIGWFWFLGTLVPMIGLVTVGQQAMADRYAYISFLGLFLAVVWGLGEWGSSLRISSVYLAAAALVVVVTLSVATRIQTRYWHDSVSLWSHAIAVTENNFVAEDNLGAELVKLGRLPEAKSHFQAALAINPLDVFSQIDLGVCDNRLGDPRAAIEHYQAALRISDDPTMRTTSFAALGSLYRKLGDYPNAQENYSAALAITPDNSSALIGLGLLAQKAGHFDQAVDYYMRAVRSEPSDVAYLLLVQALEKVNLTSQAQQLQAQVESSSPNLQAAQQAVSRMLSE